MDYWVDVAALIVASAAALVAWRQKSTSDEAARQAKRSADAGQRSAMQATRSADTAERSADAAKRSADAAEEAVGYQREQAHQARTPRILPAFVPAMGGHYHLQLRNDGPWDLDRVEVELLNPAKPYESGLQAISDADALGTTSSTTMTFVSWRKGTPRKLTLWRNGPMRTAVQLRCTCHVEGNEPWDVLVVAQPPSDA